MRIKSNWVSFIFLLAGALLLSKIIHADDYWVNRSSNAIVTSSQLTIFGVYPGDILGSIIVNKRGVGETFTIWDGSGTPAVSRRIATIDVSTNFPVGPFVYNLRLSSGLIVSKSGPLSDITILYKVNRTGL